MGGSELAPINSLPIAEQLARFETRLKHDPGASAWLSDATSGVDAYVKQRGYDLTFPTRSVSLEGGPLRLLRRAICLDIASLEYNDPGLAVEPADFEHFMDSVRQTPGAWDAACMREVTEQKMVAWLRSHNWLQPERNPENPPLTDFFYTPLLKRRA